jgi:hypothetical protein
MRPKWIVLVAAMSLIAAWMTPAVRTATAYTAEQRAVIRRMPIEQRPNRPGHVYGNTVRRLNKLAR